MSIEHFVYEKNRLIKQLKDFINMEYGWLTPNDKHSIESKIDQLNSYIEERYNDGRRQ